MQLFIFLDSVSQLRCTYDENVENTEKSAVYQILICPTVYI